MVVGQSFAETGGFGQITGGLDRIAISGAKFALYAIIFSLVLNALFLYLDARQDLPHTFNESKTRVSVFFARHPFGCSAVALLIAWGLYLVVFAPGTLTWDGARSLNQFTTDAYLENHHPVLMNLLYAALMSIGRSMGSDNLGLFLITGLQTLMMALSLAAIFSCMSRLRAPRPFMIICLVYFMLFPAWGVLAQEVLKDTLFCAVFGFFCLRIGLVIIEGPHRISRRGWVLLFAAALLVALTRNNGIYIATPTLIALLALCLLSKRDLRAHSRVKKPSAWAGAVLGGTLAVYFALTAAIYPAAGIDMRNEKEMLSIPFQQTARYLAQYPDDVTASEHDAIDAILPADELADLYNPDLADPIKEEYKLHNAKIEGSYEYADNHPSALKEYLSVWLSMGLRHPGTYIAATIANTYAYFYPLQLVDCNNERPILLIGHVGEPINETYDVSYLMPESVVRAGAEALETSTQLPILNILYSPAPYIWLFLVAAVCLIRSKRWDGLILCIPSAMLLLTVLAGPLNGHLRYMMPLMFVLPLIWAFVLYRAKPAR